MKINFQNIVDEYFNPDFNVTDKRQDPTYGYEHVWLLELKHKNLDDRIALIVYTNTTNPIEITGDQIDLEPGQTIWDIPIKGWM